MPKTREALWDEEKNEYVREIVALLLEPDTQKYHNELDRIHRENFQALAEKFVFEWVNPRRTGVVRLFGHVLIPSLVPQYEQAYLLGKTLEFDRKIFKQFLTKLLKPCQSQQDVRDVLPECLVQLLSIRHLPRTRDPAYTLKDKPALLREFKRMLVKFETYYAMRFLL